MHRVLTNDQYVVPVSEDELAVLLKYAGYRESSEGVYVAQYQESRWMKGEIAGREVNAIPENRR